ncbi:MAG TPA: hypothetical protein V6D26_09920 [Stenomitos sp.]
MLKLTPSQAKLKPRTLADIRLTPEQCKRQETFYKTTLATGVVTSSQALLLARMLLQDELLGLEARTPAQQQMAREFALAISEAKR